MLIIFCLISVIVIVVGLILNQRRKREGMDDVSMCFFIGILLLGVSILGMITIGIEYSRRGIIDDEIALYEEENAKIEDQLAQTVEEYMGYESDTYEKFKGDDLDTIINLYPELKSNELVAKQVDVYVENNHKIAELKHEKVKLKLLAWWLYFGNE